MMHHWALQHAKDNNLEAAATTTSDQAASSDAMDQVTPPMWACWAGAVLTKKTAERAFEIHRRSTTAPDLLNQLGVTADSLFPV